MLTIRYRSFQQSDWFRGQDHPRSQAPLPSSPERGPWERGWLKVSITSWQPAWNLAGVYCYVILCFVIAICIKRFMFNPQIIKSVMEQNNEEPGAKYSLVAMETTEKLQRICSHVVGYCKTVMNSAGKWIKILDYYNKDGNKKFKCYSVAGYYF